MSNVLTFPARETNVVNLRDWARRKALRRLAKHMDGQPISTTRVANAIFALYCNADQEGDKELADYYLAGLEVTERIEKEESFQITQESLAIIRKF